MGVIAASGLESPRFLLTRWLAAKTCSIDLVFADRPGPFRLNLSRLVDTDMKLEWRTAFLFSFLVLLWLVGKATSQELDDRIDRLYNDARNDEKQGRLDNAVQKYQAIIRLNPQLPAAYNNLGRLYFQRNQLEEAVKTLKHAVELDAKLAPTHALLGFSYFRMGDFNKARKELTVALELDPGDKNAKLFLGRSLHELGDYKGACEVLDKLQAEDPKNPEVLYILGLVHMELAASALGQLQKVAPDSYLIEVLLGRIAEIKQIYPEAIEHYRKALAKNPDGPGLNYALAHALWASGRFQEALPEYQRALELNPRDCNANWEAARILLPQDPRDAIRLTTRALELKSDLPEAYSIRGRALLTLKRPSEAVEDFKKAATLDPEDATLHFQLGRAYRQLGLNREAEDESAIYERMEKEAHSPRNDEGVKPL